jgi:hypothetical protein
VRFKKEFDKNTEKEKEKADRVRTYWQTKREKRGTKRE